MTITYERLTELFNYDKDSGVFTRRVTTNNRAKAGSVAGSMARNGYLYVSIGRRKYIMHRLAWLYVTGEWPKNDIDHINGIRSDNRIANLRDVSRAENIQNTRAAKSNSTSGLLGVTFDRARNKWAAAITTDGKITHLGRFDEKHEAHKSYIEAKRVLHKTCTI